MNQLGLFGDEKGIIDKKVPKPLSYDDEYLISFNGLANGAMPECESAEVFVDGSENETAYSKYLDDETAYSRHLDERYACLNLGILDYEAAYGNSFNNVSEWDMPECESVEELTDGSENETGYFWCLDEMQESVVLGDDDEFSKVDEKSLEENWEKYNDNFPPDNAGELYEREKDPEYFVMHPHLDVLIPMLYDFQFRGLGLTLLEEGWISNEKTELCSLKRWKITWGKDGPYIVGDDPNGVGTVLDYSGRDISVVLRFN